MFWENFTALCHKKGMAPNTVAKDLSISSGSVTRWKNGSVPQNATLKKIANYFGVTEEYLLNGELTELQKSVIAKISQLPEDKAELVMRLLDALTNET